MSCGLDEVKDPGAITGPSTRGIQLKMTASPDTVTANGEDKSRSRAASSGRPASRWRGCRSLFTVRWLRRTVTPQRQPASAPTARHRRQRHRPRHLQGAAALLTPTATASDPDQRPRGRTATPTATGTRASGSSFDLRPEPRTFPPVPEQRSPRKCEFSVPPASLRRRLRRGQLLHPAHDDTGEIVRFEWFFGDTGNKNYDDAPDAAHVYKARRATR